MSCCHGNGQGYISDISHCHGNGIYIPLSWQLTTMLWYSHSNIPHFHFWTISWFTSLHKCIYNLTNVIFVIVGFKIFIDLFDVVCTLVVYITYNMGNRDLPDIYTLAPWACGPQAQVYISGKSLLPML